MSCTMVLFHHAQDGSTVLAQHQAAKMMPERLHLPPITKCARRVFGHDVYNTLDDIASSSPGSDVIAADDVKKRPRRNVRFTQTVKVHYVDDDGHLSTEDEDICEEPKETYRNYYLGRARGGRIARGTRIRQSNSYPCAGDACDDVDYDSLMDELNSRYGSDVMERLGQVQGDSSSPDSGAPRSPPNDVNITFVRDATSHAMTMRLVVHLGTDYKADDVLVRANMRGNVLRVVSNNKTPPTTTTDGSSDVTTEPTNQLAPIDKRFELPVEVDPYQVRAKMDTTGNLTIEAPLTTAARSRQP